MKTLYIDINNKPIQETDEIKLFTDEGSLQYAFFYELGSQLVGKVGKSIKKAKLISDFNSPENAEAFQKIITQWNVLKAILFGEELEETFDVVIPKEFISWMSVHVDNEYRCIAAQYDKTKDHTVTIDVESFFEDAVDDEFKRNIVKVLKADSKIEQFVFNDDAVTKRSRIVKSIREKSDVVFVPFEKWNEEDIVVDVINQLPTENSIPFILYLQYDEVTKGVRVKASYIETKDVFFENYFDEYVEIKGVFYFKNRDDSTWIKLINGGYVVVEDKYVNFDNYLISNHKVKECYWLNNELILVKTSGRSDAWGLYNFENDSINIINTPDDFLAKGSKDLIAYNVLFSRGDQTNSKPFVQLINNCIEFSFKSTHYPFETKVLYYNIVHGTVFNEIIGNFGIKALSDPICQIYSLKTGDQIIPNAKIAFKNAYQVKVWYSYMNGFQPVTHSTFCISKEGNVGIAYDRFCGKCIVFNIEGKYFHLDSDELPYGNSLYTPTINNSYSTDRIFSTDKYIVTNKRVISFDKSFELNIPEKLEIKGYFQDGKIVYVDHTNFKSSYGFLTPDGQKHKLKLSSILNQYEFCVFEISYCNDKLYVYQHNNAHYPIGTYYTINNDKYKEISHFQEFNGLLYFEDLLENNRYRDLCRLEYCHDKYAVTLQM